MMKKMYFPSLPSSVAVQFVVYQKVCFGNGYLKYCQEVLLAVKNCEAEGLVLHPVIKIISICDILN